MGALYLIHIYNCLYVITAMIMDLAKEVWRKRILNELTIDSTEFGDRFCELVVFNNLDIGRTLWRFFPPFMSLSYHYHLRLPTVVTKIFNVLLRD